MKKIGTYLRPFLSGKFLVSYLIPFALVNGWAGIGSALLTIGGVNWFTLAAATWLGILWLPFCPEKLITVPLSMGIHTKLFKNDPTTRAQLDALHAEAVKDWDRIKQGFRRKKEKAKKRR